jgi:hypothetical protein
MHFMAFVMEMLELHWGNPGQRQSSGHVCAIVHTVSGKPVYSCHQHISCRRCNVQGEEEALDEVHANSLVSTCQVTHETGLP